METKENLIKELARLYTGLTVSEFSRRFGRYDKYRLARHLRLAKAIYLQTGELI
jgi:hypothetical protein